MVSGCSTSFQIRFVRAFAELRVDRRAAVCEYDLHIAMTFFFFFFFFFFFCPREI
jgi:hypothetical protein